MRKENPSRPRLCPWNSLSAIAVCLSRRAELRLLPIYGVVSYSVAQRTTELGIRLALGARPRGIRALVLHQSLTPVAAGLLVGLVASGAAGLVMQSLLFVGIRER